MAVSPSLPTSVSHPSGSEAFAFRLETGDLVIGYSGDTEWTDVLLEVARDADLFIVECYAYDGAAQNHINYRTLRNNLSKLGSKRLLLTHLSREMLDRLSDVDLEVSEDGQLLEL